mmetsp:Transcript_11635/g.35978  ORF Transcript_11635/g.35978 Transcript_11635/m.35978 type:complete len:170 (-) Transcript_11635:1556-2065(-)
MAEEEPQPDAAQEPQEAPSAGSGKFYYSADSTYDGEWTLAEAAAQGEVEGAEGVQEGEEAPAAAAPAKLRHGKGTLTTGEYSYTGDFERDVIHGEGTFTFASGASYNGSWTNGVYDGAGTYTWSDGTRYEGAWSKGKMHGEGTYTDKAGHQWTGTYYNGMGPGLERLDN